MGELCRMRKGWLFIERVYRGGGRRGRGRRCALLKREKVCMYMEPHIAWIALIQTYVDAGPLTGSSSSGEDSALVRPRESSAEVAGCW